MVGKTEEWLFTRAVLASCNGRYHGEDSGEGRRGLGRAPAVFA
jgi:hypothetical protein